MATDITLDDKDGNQITVQSDVIQVVGYDLRLDSPAHHGSQTQFPFRRALFHDRNDGLTVNAAQSYPGGLTLEGVTSITPKEGTVIVKGDLQLDIMTVDEDFNIGQLDPSGPATPAGHRPPSSPVSTQSISVFDLFKQINNLKAQVDDLTSQVAALEGKK